MATMNVSLPDDLKTFVEEQVGGGEYVSTSEYVRDLIRRERGRQRFRAMILEAEDSPMVGPVDEQFFESIRDEIQERLSLNAGEPAATERRAALEDEIFGRSLSTSTRTS